MNGSNLENSSEPYSEFMKLVKEAGRPVKITFKREPAASDGADQAGASNTQEKTSRLQNIMQRRRPARKVAAKTVTTSSAGGTDDAAVEKSTPPPPPRILTLPLLVLFNMLALLPQASPLPPLTSASSTSPAASLL